ncbi:thiamine pyrophosphate-binding protein [Rathayibacter sp. VKM Ac-2760]|uniref:alpha-keto acid decarboxylase family protein n=1 Tax=Rathayibacter sp. VKM Ac-2760 TaxID=2609253 RepID=UPI001318CB48|nr:thiamine pyrophosphate-binding protein [Rathayibacter sp. VKM Ac-2760]QHC61207.1 indolepyruvate decarboxylase [Rathayibacter sp. VKM Ac-2760]
MNGSSAATKTVTVGYYLAARLRELGVQHLFGLPGDFNLALLDEMLQVDDVEWVGTTNELNGSYAADGYARARRGIGAIVTTYGVGELSAMNGIAGSFSESVPVVHVVGMPTTSAQASGTLLHHTLVDGDFEHFVRAQREVTAMATTVRAVGATSTIDRALLAAVNSSKPVYLGIPADVARLQVSRRALDRPLRARVSDPEQLRSFTELLTAALASSADVRILVGPLAHRRALESVICSIADHKQVHVATQSASKAILDESHPANLGVYSGVHTESERTRTLIDRAEPLILAGVVLTDLLTGFFTHGFDPHSAIALNLDNARIGDEVFYDVFLDDALRALDGILESRGDRDLSAREKQSGAPALTQSVDGPLTHAAFWPRVQRWVRPGTTVVAEAGTSFYGAVGMALPNDCDLLGQPIWSSIGYTLPATMGVLLGAPKREAVLLIGDGSAQLSIQELATIVDRKLTPTIFLLDNNGYTVERLILSPDAVYQDVVSWKWPAIAAAFGMQPKHIFSVSTLEALDSALAVADGTVAAFIHVSLSRDDAPELLNRIARGLR